MKKSDTMSTGNRYSRRKFAKHCLMGGCALALSAYTLNDFVGQGRGTFHEGVFGVDHTVAVLILVKVDSHVADAGFVFILHSVAVRVSNPVDVARVDRLPSTF